MSAPGQAEPARISVPHAGLGGPRRLALSRLVLLALSTAGVGAAFVLLVTGHLTIAARVLAGDVLLILGILMIVR